jgi:CheY-like chemotaxis protein
MKRASGTCVAADTASGSAGMFAGGLALLHAHARAVTKLTSIRALCIVTEASDSGERSDGIRFAFTSATVNDTSTNSPPVVVAIVNTNPDIVRMFRMSLERTGFVVLAVHIEDIKTAAANVKTMLEEHDPRVIVYDLAPPYDQNWRFLDHLRTSTDFKGRKFVLTSVNVRAVEQTVGMDETVYEVIGQDSDILAVVRAVKEASRSRPTR